MLAVLAWQYRVRYRLPMPDAPAVVILPAKVSGESAFLADAIAINLANHLSSVPGIDMKMPPTSSELEEVDGDFRRASLAYSVNLMVLSELKGGSGSLNLSLEAIDPVTRNTLWRDSFNGTRAQYLDLMQQAGEALRKAIRPSSAAVAPVAVEGGAEAELAFREGEFHLDRYQAHHEPADFEASLKALQHALELAPKLATAAADIARLYGTATPPQTVEVQNWARRAIEIDPRSGRGYFMLATITKDLRDSLRAAVLAPEFALAHLGLGQALAYSANLAFVASRHARQIDPLYLYAPLAEAGYLHQLGRTSEAFAILDRQVVGIDPEMSYGRWTETSLMIELGWLDRADPSFKEIDKVLANQPPMPYSLGEIRRVPTLAKNGYVDDSFAILNRAVDAGTAIPFDWLKQDRRLDSLRKDQKRYYRVHEYARTKFEEMLKVLEEAKGRGEMPAYLEQSLSEVQGRVQ